VSDSRKPLEHWLAPEGAGKPLACLATSFSFDIDFFEQECLGRFLGLDWRRNEGDDGLAFLIEQEEKLAETRVSVIVDRASATEGRSLRWDLLPVGVRGGVMHAKVCLLVWENLVRCVVGSANLTPAGYRRQLEAQLVLDASAEYGPPTKVIREAIDALRSLISRAPGDRREPGPKREALSTLGDAERRLAEFGERPAKRGEPRMAIVQGGPNRSVLEGIGRVWKGGPPRSATVLSPFFDAPESNAAAPALVARLAAKGGARVKFVVESEFPTTPGSRVPVQMPPALLESIPDRIDCQLRALKTSKEKELRRLHAKVILLESASQSAVLIGSSNFTRPGLGLGEPANLEINVAIGAARDSETGAALADLIPVGDRIEAEEVEWEPEPADDEPEQPELPWGFLEALLDPAPVATLHLRLNPAELPPSWAVHDPGTATIADSALWETEGHPDSLEVPIRGDELPFYLRVVWTGAGGELSAIWPVNVTDKVALPPPEELRSLPVDALLKALASTRPLHEGLTEALKSSPLGSSGDELDPVARFAGAGQLMRRARLASQAFVGLRDRLERPAATEEALAWRLKGPFGPKAITEGLIDRAEEGGAVRGETNFLLAELALTLSRVDWRQSGRLLRGGTRIARSHARQALDELHALRNQAEEDERLAAYVERAFAEAQL
jgi:hypothetical protein